MSNLTMWPFMLAVSTYVAYQTLLKSARPEVNVLGLLTFAYFVAFACAGTLWVRNQELGVNRLEIRDMTLAALLGASIVGLEFGFVSAFRFGWPLNATGAIVNVAAALIVVPIGYLMFGEHMTWVKGLGLLLCCGGLTLLTLR